VKTFILPSVLAAFFIFPNSAATTETFQKHDYLPQYETAYKLVQLQYKM